MNNETQKISSEIAAEIDLYESNVKKFLSEQMSAEAFQRIRLQHGVYGQRQDGVQMIRIKIPMGLLNAEQLTCIADLAEEIAHNNAHITTRQDLQIHYVKVIKTPYLMRRLAAVGLTTREACGNTVRNITASPSAGVDPQEAFDVRPYAEAVTYHLLRNPICQNMPRKFKIAFDGGGVMTALPFMHDMGLTARIKDGKRGFQVVLGGGLGASPRIAKIYEEFLPVEDLIPLLYAVIQVFDRHGERKVRMKARMKFLIDKWGWDEFKSQVQKELKTVQVDPAWNNYLKNISSWDEKPPVTTEKQLPPLSKGGGGDFEGEAPSGFAGGGGDASPYNAWKKTNVWEQKQAGYSMVEVRLVTGDMKPNQMRPLAKILAQYADGKVTMMVHQNYLIRWVKNEDLPALYQELKKIGMVLGDAQTIFDITSCPGTDTCRLGISSSMGLAREIEKKLYQESSVVSEVSKDLRIKISGCPNSCGQHHIANIGFHGGAVNVNGRTMPAFQMFLGGTSGREMAVGDLSAQIPSKNVPSAVVALVKNYTANKKADESFNAFYKRHSKDDVKKILGEFLKTPSYEERPDYYTDWEGTEEFGLQKGVIGECAGSAGTDRPPMVKDGLEPLKTAEAFLAHGDFVSAANKAYESIAKSAEGLLYYRFVQTFNEVETTHEFENHFVKTGVFPEWKNFHHQIQGEIQDLRQKEVSESTARFWVEKAKDFSQKLLVKEPEVQKTSPRKPVPLQPDNLAI